ncbi:MAG: Re/Si-specific NAD(P)(+) transhydrogenase subunit alpha [Balneolaceae bacterium]|nr:MAG: Re/Si-specific NAD(P)(+) transhydrogenase subunit alpha [Balneolaceae bacterium]
MINVRKRTVNIAVPKETADGETRVALTPPIVSKIVSDGLTVTVQKGAGLQATFTDADYEQAGAAVEADVDELYRHASVVLKVQKPTSGEIGMMPPGTTLISFLWALSDPDLVGQLKNAGITAIGMDALPRISRAQTMDALSAMSSLAGYKSVLLGANALGKYLPMLVTAAGTIPPANVLVLGAGVAGLQAIATARRLGAVVEAFDVRPAVKEQVESLGARFIDIPGMDEDTETSGGYARELKDEARKRQREALREHIRKSDLVITTALIPGKPAPTLITAEMVGDMSAGSVIVDMAAEQGGNCELTRPGEDHFTDNGVIIRGPLNIPAAMPVHASQLYARTIHTLLKHLVRDGRLHLDFEDEITRQATITHDGRIVSPLLSHSKS